MVLRVAAICRTHRKKRNADKFLLICWFVIFVVVVPCILITLKFFSPTNAPLYYTYKMLKCTVKISYVCSYMFRSTWTIFREPIPSLAKATFLWNYLVKIHRYMFSTVAVKSVSSCGVYCVPCSVWLTHCTHCTAHNTHHSLKHFLLQNLWTYNDVFLLTNSTKL